MSIGALIHRYPMRTRVSAFREADRAIDEAQRRFRAFPTLHLHAERNFAPRVSAVENEDEYVITAELPGVDPADLDVSVEQGVLTIKGQRHFPGRDRDVETDEASADQDAPARFQRRYRFNGEIDEEAVQAKLKNGLMTVTVPKPKRLEPEVRTIPVEAS